MPLLETRNLIKSFARRAVVQGVTLSMQAGEVVGLLGPNGAGKTTTFNMIVGRLRPDEGEVFFDGVDVTKLAMYQRARLGMGYLPQEPSIFDGLSVSQNLLAVLEFHESHRRRRRERLDELLEKLGLTEHADRPAAKLSGGLRRRLEITRVLITRPKLILLDEPFAGVDPLVVEDIQKIVGLLKSEGLGLLITDHNVLATLKITDRSYIIRDGVILAAGSSEELLSNEEARTHYLGSQFMTAGA